MCNLNCSCQSDTELDLKRSCRIDKRREIIALDKQGTQQQGPESPTVIPLGVTVGDSGLCYCVACLSGVLANVVSVPITVKRIHVVCHIHVRRFSHKGFDIITIAGVNKGSLSK